MSGGASLRALVADDERLLREQLKSALGQAWPGLTIVAEAREGREAVTLAAQHRPDVVFLDIRMPGMTGIEAAQEIAGDPGWRGDIVFVTAYDEYAVAAFERGAVDYLLKPVSVERLAQTAQRLQARRGAPAPPGGQAEAQLDALMARLAELQRGLDGAGTAAAREPLRWIQSSSGSSVRLIDVDEVLFFRSDEKYTRVQTRTHEALVRTTVRDLAGQLDPAKFWQIHRSTIVNLEAIAEVVRDESGRQRVRLKDHPEVLEVSRSYAHLFRGA